MAMHDSHKPVRLVQLSDCHLTRSPKSAYRGVYADAGLQQVVACTVGWNPDAVLLTGDLSEDGSTESYRRLDGLLQPLNCPLMALPGNHDRPTEMRGHFPAGPWSGPLAVPLGAWHIILLDTAEGGRIDGRVREGDLVWLAEWLDSGSRSPVLLALHHQPVPVGSAWIDRYMLRAADALLQVVEANERVRCLVWGHVHQAFAGRNGAAELLGCPSTAANSLPGAERFTADPAGPAGRWLELGADGGVRTGLLRLP